MCGICGTLGFGDRATLSRMALALRHRGPDADGSHVDETHRVFLANQRLSIIDVEGGKQPVASEDGQIVAIQNGELYNFRELRKALEAKGHRFRSQTDTEVIPHLYEEYGEDFPKALDGMFAIAVFDARTGRVVLARDHIGIKPLYLWERGQRLAFASEVKALLQVDGIDAALDLQSLHFLLNIRFVPGAQSLFAGIRKLEPGSVLVWQDGVRGRRRYWRLDARPDRSIRRPEDCAPQVRHLLGEAVRKQMVSDVPLGLYLSGGIDSSSLVALAAQHHPEPVRTFSLGFDEPTDELGDAELVAKAFGTDHRASTITFDALSVFPTVTWHVEEPKENAIQLYVLAQHARQHVTVALSGLGGDELFGGYKIFDWLRPTLPAHRLVSRAVNRRVLWPARRVVAGVLGSLGSMRHDLARRAIDFAFSAGVPARAYLLMRNMWEHDRRLFEAIYAPQVRSKIERQVEAFFAPVFDDGLGDPRESVLRAELAYKMVDDFLMNEDRTSMASSLEVRVPFLDKALVEYAFSIPAEVKFAHGLKTVLKVAMADLLPARTLQKPKWGFTFDAYHQFQKDLAGLARRELTREVVAQQGLFNFELIDAILRHPPHRWMRWHYFLLWLILGVKVWEDLFVKGKTVEASHAVA